MIRTISWKAEIDSKFREWAIKRFGKSKGSFQMALEEAVESWTILLSSAANAGKKIGYFEKNDSVTWVDEIMLNPKIWAKVRAEILSNKKFEEEIKTMRAKQILEEHGFSEIADKILDPSKKSKKKKGDNANE